MEHLTAKYIKADYLGREYLFSRYEWFGGIIPDDKELKKRQREVEKGFALAFDPNEFPI